MSEKPLSEWTLAEVKQCCLERRNYKTCGDCPLYGRVCGREFDNFDLTSTRLSEREQTICRLFGAKWVSRDKEDGTNSVHLWKSEPTKFPSGVFSCAPLVGTAITTTFPNVRPGDLFEVPE